MSEMNEQEQKAKLEALTQEFQGADLGADPTVGELTDEQKAKLAEMRLLVVAGVAETDGGASAEQIQEDGFLLKHLMVAGWDPVAASAAYVATLVWRKGHDVDNVLRSPKHNVELMKMVAPHAYAGFDKQGRPTYIEKTGKWHVQAVVYSVPVQEFIDAHTYGMETLYARMQESAERTGRPVDRFASILDLEGLGMYHLNAVNLLRACTEFDQKHYPERVGRIFIVNAPWIMPTLWAAVSPVLPESIRQRIHVCSANFKEELLEHFDADQLPVEYGGTLADVDFGEVPYEVVRQKLLKDASGLQLEEEYVAARYTFEKTVEASAGDVVAWSFQVDTGYDIGFSAAMTMKESGANVMVKNESKCNANKGEYTATEPCSITFKWDNSYSYFNGKNLHWHVSVVAAAADADAE